MSCMAIILGNGIRIPVFGEWLSVTAFFLSYCILLCYVWLSSLAGLLFSGEETRVGSGYSGKVTWVEIWEEWKEGKNVVSVYWMKGNLFSRLNINLLEGIKACNQKSYKIYKTELISFVTMYFQLRKHFLILKEKSKTA